MAECAQFAAQTDNLNIDAAVRNRIIISVNGIHNLVTVGAVVEADVEGNNIIIKGTVIGNVTARQHLEIQSTGRMNGDITARSIDFKDGSSFEGRSQMIKNHRQPGENAGGGGSPVAEDE